VKHELGERGATVKEGHLSTGSRAIDAAREMLQWFEELYGADRPDDPEIRGLRAIRQMVLAKLCFESGRREEARAFLGLARSAYPGRRSCGPSIGVVRGSSMVTRAVGGKAGQGRRRSRASLGVVPTAVLAACVAEWTGRRWALSLAAFIRLCRSAIVCAHGEATR
jgi:AcrR family transcriptional regulator